MSLNLLEISYDPKLKARELHNLKGHGQHCQDILSHFSDYFQIEGNLEIIVV